MSTVCHRLGLGVILLLLSSATLAYVWEPNVYGGVEIQFNRNDVVKNRNNVQRVDNKPYFSPNQSSTGIFAGTHMDEYWGIEVGYSWFSKTSKTISFIGYPNTALKNETNSLHVDFMGYLPANEEFSLIGNLGLGFMTTKLEGRYNGTQLDQLSGRSSRAGFRIGVGVRYLLPYGLGIRMMAKHNQGNKILKHTNSVNFGFFYQYP